MMRQMDSQINERLGKLVLLTITLLMLHQYMILRARITQLFVSGSNALTS